MKMIQNTKRYLILNIAINESHYMNPRFRSQLWRGKEPSLTRLVSLNRLRRKAERGGHRRRVRDRVSERARDREREKARDREREHGSKSKREIYIYIYRERAKETE